MPVLGRPQQQDCEFQASLSLVMGEQERMRGRERGGKMTSKVCVEAPWEESTWRSLGRFYTNFCTERFFRPGVC